MYNNTMNINRPSMLFENVKKRQNIQIYILHHNSVFLIHIVKWPLSKLNIRTYKSPKIIPLFFFV